MSSGFEIDWKKGEGDDNCDLAKNSAAPCRGLQKVFKAKSNTSKRSRLYATLFQKRKEKQQRYCKNRPARMKMTTLMKTMNQVFPDHKEEYSDVDNKSNTLHYFAPSNVKAPSLNITRDYVFHKVSELRIIDDTNGFFMMDGDGTPLFIMPPRAAVLDLNRTKYCGDLFAIKQMNKHTIHIP